MSTELQRIVQPVEIDARKKIEQINNMPVANRVDCDKATEWLKAVTIVRKDFEKAGAAFLQPRGLRPPAQAGTTPQARSGSTASPMTVS